MSAAESTGRASSGGRPVVRRAISNSSCERRVADEHLEHEAVLLRLRQRVGALLLDRVLRGEHEERIDERVPHAAHAHLPLLHRLEERGLRLRRRAVDLVGEDDVGEQRPLEEPQLPRARGPVLLEHVGADDVGRHQVGRELDAAEGEVEAPWRAC